MSAPKSAPAGLRETPYYTSPDVVPAPWKPDRPGVVDGPQPFGPRLGTQGPDQGYALVIARRLVPELELQPGELEEDAVQGCLGVALKRASLYGRAPVVHDLRDPPWQVAEEPFGQKPRGGAPPLRASATLPRCSARRRSCCCRCCRRGLAGWRQPRARG